VFPVDGSLTHGAPLPSRGSRRPRFPTVNSTMRALRLPVRAFLVRYGFRPRFHMLLHRSCSPWRSRGGGEPPPGLGALVNRSPSVRRLACGHALDLSGFLAIHPTPLPCSQTPAGPAGPRRGRSRRCCPRSQHAEGSSRNMISRLTQGFDVCCLRFTSDVATAHARLASGWRAAPLPGGS
jgi:hypothetical protein